MRLYLRQASLPSESLSTQMVFADVVPPRPPAGVPKASLGCVPKATAPSAPGQASGMLSPPPPRDLSAAVAAGAPKPVGAAGSPATVAATPKYVGAAGATTVAAVTPKSVSAAEATAAASAPAHFPPGAPQGPPAPLSVKQEKASCCKISLA